LSKSDKAYFKLAKALFKLEPRLNQAGKPEKPSIFPFVTVKKR
jgi:hypothetical protein